MATHCAANAGGAYAAGTQGNPDKLYTTAPELGSALTRSSDPYLTNSNGDNAYLYTPTYVTSLGSGYFEILFGGNASSTTNGGMLINQYMFTNPLHVPANNEIFYLRLFDVTNQTTGVTTYHNVCLRRQPSGNTQTLPGGEDYYEIEFVTATDEITAGFCLTDTCDVLTPNGYVNVKDLSVGDLVTTPEGKDVKITKVMKPTTHHAIGKAYPHFIPKNSLGENKPTKDTFISKNHAYKSGDEWLCGQFNIEHNATNWDKDFVTYYNIMTEDYPKHTLVVNGVEIESWGGYELNKPETRGNIKLRREKLGFK
jgi:hypothetical protein